MWVLLGRSRHDRRCHHPEPSQSHLPGDAARRVLLTDITSAPFAREVQQNITMCGVALKSWIWTVVRSWGVCNGMDDDTADLVQTLCTRAGMIMEDLSVEALTISGADRVAVGAGLTLLADGAKTISALIAAASALSCSSCEVGYPRC
jgi:hypothetical protein